MSSDSKFIDLTRNYGFALIMIGIIGFALAKASSYTPLIPAALGLLTLGCVSNARSKPNIKKQMMHICLLIALIATLGSFRGVADFASLIQGQSVERPKAVISMLVTAIISIAYLILGIQSFVQARRS